MFSATVTSSKCYVFCLTFSNCSVNINVLFFLNPANNAGLPFFIVTLLLFSCSTEWICSVFCHFNGNQFFMQMFSFYLMPCLHDSLFPHCIPSVHPQEFQTNFLNYIMYKAGVPQMTAWFESSEYIGGNKIYLVKKSIHSGPLGGCRKRRT
jgi:hypothetical protein